MHYFRSSFMKRDKKFYSAFHLVSAIFLMIALLWLTVSTPFLFASQQYLAKQSKAAAAHLPVSSNDEEAASPVSNANTTEEKVPSGNSLSEEYLHDNHTEDSFFSIVSQYHKCEDAGTYIAFHGELLVPPPNLA